MKSVELRARDSTHSRMARRMQGNSKMDSEKTLNILIKAAVLYAIERFHGLGVIHYLNGDKYEANWENGVAIRVHRLIS